MRCNPTLFGVFLRLIIAFVLIAYGIAKDNWIVLIVGMIPPVRLSYFFFTNALKPNKKRDD